MRCRRCKALNDPWGCSIPNLSGAKDRDKCKLVAKRVVLSPVEFVISVAVGVDGWFHGTIRASNSEPPLLSASFFVDVFTKTFFRVFS